MGYKLIKDVFENRYYTLYILLVAITPLLFVSNTNELFEFPKMFFVYLISVIMFFLFCFELIDKKIAIKKPSIIVLIFLLCNVVSAIFSSHLYTSLWGYYTRFNGGIISILSFFVLYLVIKNKLKLEDFEKLIMVATLPIIAVSIYGIFQHYGIGNTVWTKNSAVRVFSTFGQPNWLAQYLVMLLPVCIYYSFFSRKAVFWGIIYLLGFSCLWFTYPLSGLVGLVVSMIILVFIFRKNIIGNGNVKVIFLILMFGSITIAVLNPGIFSARLHDLFQDFKKFIAQESYTVLNKSVENLKVFAQTSQTTPDAPTPQTLPAPQNQIQELSAQGDNKVSDPGLIRLGLWRGTLDLITSNPKVFLIGTGQETYPYAFQPYRPPILNYSSEWNFVFNKPHNYYFQLWSEIGLIGLVAYLLLIISIIKKIPHYLIPGFVGFLITNIFGWPVVSTSLLFWLFIAYAEIYKK